MFVKKVASSCGNVGSMLVKAMTLLTDKRTYGVPAVNIKMMRREYLGARVGMSAEDDLEISKRCLDIVEVTKWTRPINRSGSKLKGHNSLKLKPRCVNIKSLVPYVHARLIYVRTEDIIKKGKVQRPPSDRTIVEQGMFSHIVTVHVLY